MDQPYLSPRQVAERLGVDRSKVIRWITSGELIAINVATSRTGKQARWRIDPKDFESFLARRKTTPPAPKRRRRKALPPVPNFI